MLREWRPLGTFTRQRRAPTGIAPRERGSPGELGFLQAEQLGAPSPIGRMPLVRGSGFAGDQPPARCSRTASSQRAFCSAGANDALKLLAASCASSSRVSANASQQARKLALM